MRGALLVLLAGCGTGPNLETVVAELRVVAAIAEPPAVEVGQAYDLTVVVADPLGEGGELLVWTCAPGEGCQSALTPLVEEFTTVPVVASGADPVWMLACAPGLCGDLSAVGDPRLEDPASWLQGLPISGVSAASRTTRIALAGVEVLNPVLEDVPDGLIEGASDKVVPLAFTARGAATAYGLATTGGFSAPQYDVASDGAVTLRWVGGSDPGSGRAYVVLEDGLGGTAVWAADAATIGGRGGD